MKELCLGIDLGTTNSVLAMVNEKPNGEIVSKVIELPRPVDMYSTMSGQAKLTTMKKSTLPSCVYYRPESRYEPLVGDYAKTQYSLRPHLVVKSIKSQMGNPEAMGLSPDLPDHTPAQIASRILEHILKEAKRILRVDKIEDVVITVPANFDSIMCKATLDAASLAGIQVKKADGSEKPILLSEPNAVIYDLMNQIYNGEIPSSVLDLTTPKKVLVFDLGGGTLDITMHTIQKREGYDDILKVTEIATDRYTLLGGDNFDEQIAKEMYKRYLKQYSSYPKAVSELESKKEIIMPMLRVYAENLKLELNESLGDYDSSWDDDEDTGISVGGNMGGIGYAYDDTFTKEEIEEILSPFMAKSLTYNDYKHLDNINDTYNIIYPILDVLNKASVSLGEDVKVDAVIVNGGMSKFYMVTDRLKEFFGIDPIVALDPDLSVARGAAIYHYYLNKYNQSGLQDDMRLVGADQLNDSIEPLQPVQAKKGMSIEWGKTILNDALYLGLKNGEVHEIISTGSELPYLSSIQTGFKIEPGQSKIDIPIRSKNLDGTYRTIASGSISFDKYYENGAYVAFQIAMNRNKVITMTAWTCNDSKGEEKIEEGTVELIVHPFASKITPKTVSNIPAASGKTLNPRNEINQLVQLCNVFERCNTTHKKKAIAKNIADCLSKIYSCENKNDFSKVVLDTIQLNASQELKNRLFILARKIGANWPDSDKERLARLCMSQIEMDLLNFTSRGPKVSTNIQAINTLSICANSQQLARLEKIHNNPKYYHACVYTYGKRKYAIPWLVSQLNKDINKAMNQSSNSLQASAYSVGMALNQVTDNQVISLKEETLIIKHLISGITSKKLNKEELICCIISLGLICDQRKSKARFDDHIIQAALGTIADLDYYYPYDIVMSATKACSVASKMIQGDLLNNDEEKFLLAKLEQ